MKEGGVSRHSFKNFLSQSTKKFRKGTFLLFTNILVSKNFMHKRWGMKQGGVSRYSVKIFCLSVPKNLVGKPFYFFYKTSGSKNFMDKKWGMMVGGVSRYSVKSFLCQSTEVLRRELFCVSQNFWYRKFSWIRGGGGGGRREECHDFLSKVFCLTSPKLFGEPFSVS